LSPPFYWSGVNQFEGWGLVTPDWGPISLNPRGDSYGKLDFNCKRGFCGMKVVAGEGFVDGLTVGGSAAHYEPMTAISSGEILKDKVSIKYVI
jgi:hypothetical protein